jgi:integrase/recombinase XerC
MHWPATLSADDAQHLHNYLRHVQVEKRLAARTLALYTEDLQRLAAEVLEPGLDLLRLQPAHMRRAVARMHAGGRTPSGIARVLSSWRGLFRWLGREGLIGHNPVQDVRAPKARKPLPKALPVDQAVQLAAHLEPDDDPALAARDHAVAELLYGCGLRIGELVGLDVQASAEARGWIDLAEAEVFVLGKGGKRRSVPLGRAAVQALRDWLTARAGWAPDVAALFVGQRGQRLTPQHLRLRLRQLGLKAGVNTPVHPHMLRHSFASHVLQSSGDLRAVQELLGHANIGTTQVYTRLDFQHLAKVYDAAHPRARRSKP